MSMPFSVCFKPLSVYSSAHKMLKVRIKCHHHAVRDSKGVNVSLKLFHVLISKSLINGPTKVVL